MCFGLLSMQHLQDLPSLADGSESVFLLMFMFKNKPAICKSCSGFPFESPHYVSMLLKRRFQTRDRATSGIHVSHIIITWVQIHLINISRAWLRQIIVLDALIVTSEAASSFFNFHKGGGNIFLVHWLLPLTMSSLISHLISWQIRGDTLWKPGGHLIRSRIQTLCIGVTSSQRLSRLDACKTFFLNLHLPPQTLWIRSRQKTRLTPRWASSSLSQFCFWSKLWVCTVYPWEQALLPLHAYSSRIEKKEGKQLKGHRAFFWMWSSAVLI